MGLTFEQQLDAMVDKIKTTKRERDEIEILWYRSIQKSNNCDPQNPPCRSPVPGGVYCGCALELIELKREAKP